MTSREFLLFGAVAVAACAGQASSNKASAGSGGDGASAGMILGGTSGRSSTGGLSAAGSNAGTIGEGGEVGVGAAGGALVAGGGGSTGGRGGAGAGTSGDGGTSASGGTDPSGAGAGTGGGAGGTSDAGTGGSSGAGGTVAGSGGSAGALMITPSCDIYEVAGTPCVAAYSTVRRLYSLYNGPLYQVRRGGPDPNIGSGGETQDIGMLASGFADVAAQNAFCGSEVCTFSVLYDQSGRGNDLTAGDESCYQPTFSQGNEESDAKLRPTSVGGHDVYALYTEKGEGYRDNDTMGMPLGAEEQGVYMVMEGAGKRPDAGCCCCWDFGSGSTDNCYGPTGSSSALFLGIGYWGTGAGEGPWFMGDFEAGVWAGGSEASNYKNENLPSMTMDYAFGILKTGPNHYAIRVGDATTGSLTTAYDGPAPAEFVLQGGIILGVGSDNSNVSDGTFLEGAITAGMPEDAVDQAVHENIKALGYGR